MENASKALIIAGAILLAIIIISLGIVVVTNTRSTIDKANVNQTEVETFNSRFEAYVGSGKTQSEVRALLSAVFSNNGAQTTNATGHTITVKFKNTTITSIPTTLTNGSTYTISATYGTDGYINAINIT